MTTEDPFTPIDLAAELPVIVPRAVDWAVRLASASAPRGQALGPPLLNAAKQVGVRRPDLIRVCVVDTVPLPADPLLARAATQVGLAEEGMAGLTLDHVVFVRRGHENDVRLMSHEFRHVAQYEACGGIAQFLGVHLGHLAAFGYEDSPFEVDARAHELT